LSKINFASVAYLSVQFHQNTGKSLPGDRRASALIRLYETVIRFLSDFLLLKMFNPVLSAPHPHWLVGQFSAV
jgi:hypothetical protein